MTLSTNFQPPTWEVQGDLLALSGDWLAMTIGQVNLPSSFKGQTLRVVSLKDVQSLDIAGGWMINKIIYTLSKAQSSVVAWKGLQESYKEILEYTRLNTSEKVSRKDSPSLLLSLKEQIEELGEKTILFLKGLPEQISFVGLCVVKLIISFSSLRLFRWKGIIHQINRIGVGAVPIVALISFLIGTVLTFQGAFQLKRFGAEIYTVDLLAFSVLREVGVLLTAIVVAGRSGSAFAAQIGSMKLNEEIDALKTMGLDPFIVLVVPRIIAMVLALPLLTFLSNGIAIAGGALMSLVLLDISLIQFLKQLHQGITNWTYWLGILKAPFFAFLIALVGCYEGLKVQGGAESIGQRTTQAVVSGIFWVIVCDALFSILFSVVGI